MLRIATIGTSMITSDFIEVVNADPRAAFVGTMSRDTERGSAFTDERGGERTFATLGEICAAEDVDAVYIASPNALHHDQALACIHAGKHVLVEKPFCATEAEALEVFTAAQEAGVVALEAMRPLHDPALHAIEDALGELGRIRRASFRFGKYSSRYDEVLAGRHTNIFDCEMASGALMDIGIYTIEPMLEIFGAPHTLACTGVLLDPATQAVTNGPIDGAGTLLVGYGPITVDLSYSKITNDLMPSQIEGEHATLTIDKISTPQHARIDYRGTAVRNAAKAGYSAIETSTRELELPVCGNTMAYELADFIEAVEGASQVDDEVWETAAGRHELGHYRDVTLFALQVADAARHKMGVTFPADRGNEA